MSPYFTVHLYAKPTSFSCDQIDVLAIAVLVIDTYRDLSREVFHALDHDLLLRNRPSKANPIDRRADLVLR